MWISPRAAPLVVAVVIGLYARSSAATTLTLDQALALARSQAPGLVAARMRIDEARGRIEGASVTLRENPIVELAAGRRDRGGQGLLELELSARQNLELGGRRGARLAGARAGVDAERARAEDAQRRLLREVAAAFLRALHAGARGKEHASAIATAELVLRVAERRHKAGELPVLDVNVATAALGRARAEARRMDALRLASLGELRVLLGIEGATPVEVTGNLGDRKRFDLDALLARAPERADLRALAAEAREAHAEARLGGALGWPDLGVGILYKREEGADALLGALTFTLPAWSRGQEQRTTGQARERRANLEVTAGQQAARTTVRTAFEVYRLRVEAAETIEHQALPLLAENEALARRSYEAGQMSLGESLLIRRESLETRLDHQDHLLEAALAGIDLETAAGVLR